jgi:hypothetical protein
MSPRSASCHFQLDEEANLSHSNVCVVQTEPSITRVLLVDVECLLCARAAGVLTSDRWPPTTSVEFRRAGSSTTEIIADWWHLRCSVCGGNTVANEITAQRVRTEDPVEWPQYARRGRPPAWLVNQRRAELLAMTTAHEDT